MYDIFYVSKNEGDADDWRKIKSKYPAAQRISNVKSFEDLKTKSFTKMFWVIWDDLDLDDSFDLTEYRATKWDDIYVHVFKNGDYFDGVCLFPKSITISQREFHHRFFVNKKEIDIKISRPKNYKVYSPKNYDDYKKINDEMFWLVWPEVQIIDCTVMDLYFSHHNSYDRRENHVFKNLCNDKESFISGVILCSKYKPLSRREFEKQYAVDKKEHDKIASRYRYPVFTFNDYDQYLETTKKIDHKMFWGIWPEIEILDSKIFDFYFDPYDGIFDYDRKENHMFMHQFNGKEIFANGLVLFSKEKTIGKREFNYRFLVEKKEQPIVASKHQLYDVIFISYNEPNAEENYQDLLKKCPRAKRVHGVKGIHQAHIKAAEISSTDMIWIVDGDALVVDDFDFNYCVTNYERHTVHVWRSRNPINDLEYGYGGVKLLPREMTLNMDTDSTDMTTSIGEYFKAVDQVSNITAFNTDPFNTWKSAFRECVKLSSKVINKQNDTETEERLLTWTTVGNDKLYGDYAIKGAIEGRHFGTINKSNPEMLKKINDFDWLREQFNG